MKKPYYENPRPKCVLAILRYGTKSEGTKENFRAYPKDQPHAYFRLGKLSLVLAANGWYLIQKSLPGGFADNISTGTIELGD